MFCCSCVKTTKTTTTTKEKQINKPALVQKHTLSIAFRHHPPNSARTGYHHWRGTLCLRAAVHRRCPRPPKGLGTDKTVEATQRQSTHMNARLISPGVNFFLKEKKFHPDSHDFGFICAGVTVSNVTRYNRNVQCNLSSCNKLTAICAPKKNLLSDLFFYFLKTYGAINRPLHPFFEVWQATWKDDAAECKSTLDLLLEDL